jgi:hypothetical protein
VQSLQLTRGVARSRTHAGINRLKFVLPDLMTTALYVGEGPVDQVCAQSFTLTATAGTWRIWQRNQAGRPRACAASGQSCGKGIGGVEVWWVALGVIAKRALVHTTIETMDPKVGAYA